MRPTYTIEVIGNIMLIRELDIQKALAQHFRWQRNIVIPNLFFDGFEMDIFMLSPSNYVTEIEIKTSLNDWRKDKHKEKWRQMNRNKICKFYYAVPESLIDKVPAFLCGKTGLIKISNENSVTIVRPAKRLTTEKLEASEVIKYLKAPYYRFWAYHIFNYPGRNYV